MLTSIQSETNEPELAKRTQIGPSDTNPNPNYLGL